MIDPRYKFVITVSAHILVENEKNQILMLKRPDTWEWGPGRWGIVGGKLYEKESLFEAIKRKTTQELGLEITPEGLFEIKQLIIEDKQAFMFFFASKYHKEKFSGEMAGYKWFGIEDLEKMPLTEFAEYYYKEMLTRFLKGNKLLLPISMVDTLNYFDLKDDKKYKTWFEGMIKKDYDPKIIPDFKKWEKSGK